MTAKERYAQFCEKIYVPIYSKPWWMDAVCGPDNWDVWLYEEDDRVTAAMPYYKEQRGQYSYITKAPLTQNNGLLIQYPPEMKGARRQALEERVVDAMSCALAEMKLDVYEQQYHYTFKNFLPFVWNGFAVIPRITYVIPNQPFEAVEGLLSAKMRKETRKSKKYISSVGTVEHKRFYDLYVKVFEKQDLPCPFTFTFLSNLFTACEKHDAGKMFCAFDADGNVLGMHYEVWDEKSMYHLVGGVNPDFLQINANQVLTLYCIREAMERGLDFDFEGSMIRPINHAFRKYEGEMKTYYRIRKVFEPAIIRAEAEQQIARLNAETCAAGNGG